ncbi:hypothetical protein TYRP_019328 [Tyrophagus putrescentiae]|nr:hypothetical protein TYRP_019328 [Tyrophagus putrescentiae]
MAQENIKISLAIINFYRNECIEDASSIVSSSRPATPPTSLLTKPKSLHDTFSHFDDDMSNGNPREWKKVLYLKQGVPDNFVPNSFLQDLRTNGVFLE